VWGLGKQQSPVGVKTPALHRPPNPGADSSLERGHDPIPIPGPWCLPVAQVPLHPLLAGAMPRVGVAGAHAARWVAGAGSGWGETKARGEPRSCSTAPARGWAPSSPAAALAEAVVAVLAALALPARHVGFAEAGP